MTLSNLHFARPGKLAVRLLVAFVALSVASTAYVASTTDATAQPSPDRPYRLFVPQAARDGIAAPPPVNGGDLPPADPSYCPGSSGGNAPPTPPNSVLGFLRPGGVAAPAGTIVQIYFDGKAGPAIRAREAGGYRVDYAGGLAGCANQVGARIGIRVNGVLYDSGVNVGSPDANPFLRFDIVQ